MVKTTNFKKYRYDVIYITDGEDPDEIVLASFDNPYKAIAHMVWIVANGDKWHWDDDDSQEHPTLVREGYDYRIILKKTLTNIGFSLEI